LGGRAAATVARKLAELAAHDQILVITHLPQIAGAASTHFRVEKVERGGRSSVAAITLDGRERIEELARMIAGEEVGDSARAHAKELLGHGA
jgi:DNA repair protein RecN (Recombination protein N)